MKSRTLSAGNLLLLSIGAAFPSCRVGAVPGAAKLACPDGTTQITVTNACGVMVGCVPSDTKDTTKIRGPVQEFDLSGTKRAEYTCLNWRQRIGPVMTWHANGVRRLEARYVEEPNWYGSETGTDYDGPVTEWYSNGGKHAEATYKRGKLEGVARLWSASNPTVLRIESNWLDGQEDGKWRAFFPDGKPEIEIDMKKGHLNGAVTLWSANRQKIEEFLQFDDRKQGPHRKWTPQGRLLLEESYEQGHLEGKFKEFFANGQRKIETTYKDGNMDGPYSEEFESGGLKSKGDHASGKQQGPWKTWHPNGQLESESVFADGHELPGWKRYFPDGKLSERLGTDGIYESFHPNGIRSCVGAKGPKGRTGSWVWYDEQGRREKTGVFVNDWPQGDFVWFDESGRIIVKDKFRDGVFASLRCPKGTRLVMSTGDSVRWVACRDGKDRDHGMRYEFSIFGEGEYLTAKFDHGIREDFCPDGVDPYFCNPGQMHAPFAVLRQKAVNHVPEKAAETAPHAAPAGEASVTAIGSAATSKQCGDDRTDKLTGTLDAFGTHVEIWNPSALYSPAPVVPDLAAGAAPPPPKR